MGAILDLRLIILQGSAISIAVGQVPTMMGISGLLNTRDPAYLVIINTLRNLGHSTLDAAMGLTALAMLYLIRHGCNWAARRYPNQKKTFFFLSTLRTVFVILLYTMISWLANRHHRDKPLFKILKTVPRGMPTISYPGGRRIVEERGFHGGGGGVLNSNYCLPDAPSFDQLRRSSMLTI